jgi:hypothetical protein
MQELAYRTAYVTLDRQLVQCVIIACSREESANLDKKRYVLLVVPTSRTAARGQAIYKRVRAVFRLARHIYMKELGTTGRANIC